MKLVFGNSAWVDAPERLVLRGGRWSRRSLRVRFGLVLHPTQGPILIDTGYTEHSVGGRARSWGLRFYCNVLRPRLVPDEQPEVLLARYGFCPRDVKTVIITHFHADHVSGLKLFCNAEFVTFEAAWDRLCRASSFQNLRHGIFKELIPEDFENRLVPLEQKQVVQTPLGTEGYDVLGDGLITACPLPGHADGHFGLLVHLPSNVVFYAVDTQWVLAALSKHGRPGFPSRLVADEPSQLEVSSELVRRFRDDGLGDVILCHDPNAHEFDCSAAVRDGPCQ